MKIYEKINSILKEKGFKISELHRRINELFGEDSIVYLTLYRTLTNKTKIRESSLFQIACALGTTTDELKSNTDAEEHINRYVYNKNAYLEITDTNLSFLPAKLVLFKKAKTPTEQDPKEKGAFIKWIYIIQGELIVNIVTPKGIERQKVRKGETFSFNSCYAHNYENNRHGRTVAILIQNPKYI